RAVAMDQFIQILGAVLVLIAYIAAQLRMLDGKSYPYLVLNLLGSGLLAVLAAAGAQWGFLLLEGTWALVSLLSLGGRVVARRSWRSASAAGGHSTHVGRAGASVRTWVT